jgi:hypothetical protein
VTAAIGAALLVARPDRHDGLPSWIGTVLLFVGIALLISDFLNFGFPGRRGGNRPPEDKGNSV